MMNILDEVRKVNVQVVASPKDGFTGRKLFQISLPDEFPAGISRIVCFQCLRCDYDFKFTMIEIPFVNKKVRMYLTYVKDLKLFELLGNTFKLKANFEKRENNEYDYYDFSFTGKYKSVADIASFKCPHCQAKYMMSFACYEGENEKKPEPDIIYIDKILQVEADFEELKGMF